MEIDIDDLTGGAAQLLQTITDDPKIYLLREPSDTVLLAGAYACAKRLVVSNATALVLGKLQDALDEQILLNGECPEPDEPESRDDWESALDDKAEAIYEPYARYLSADWLARNTIACRLHLENGVADTAKSFGEEIWKFATTDHDPEGDRRSLSVAKFLSRVGVTADYIRKALAERKPQENKQVDPNAYTLVDTMKLIHETVTMLGTSPDDLMSELDDMSDGDDGLALGAAQRLGCADIDVENLRVWRLTDGNFEQLVAQIVAGDFSAPANTAQPVTVQEVGDEAAELAALMGAGDDVPSADEAAELAAMLGGIMGDAIGAAYGAEMQGAAAQATLAVAGVAAAKPKKGRRTKEEKDAEELAKMTGGAVTPADKAQPGVPLLALEVVKAHSGSTDVQIAEKLGVSKSTFVNYLKGRAVLYPDMAQLNYLSATLHEISAKSAEALSQIKEFAATVPQR